MEIYMWSGAGLLGLLVVALLASFRMQVLQHRKARQAGRSPGASDGRHLAADRHGRRRNARRRAGDRAPRRSASRRPSRRPRAATQRRVSTAARRGRSVQDIAAKEKMSESEVRLRLQMSARRPAGRRLMPRCADERCGRWRPDLSSIERLAARRFAGWARCSSTGSGTARARAWSRRLARD